MILVPLFDLKFLTEFAAGGVGTSNRRHSNSLILCGFDWPNRQVERADRMLRFCEILHSRILRLHAKSEDQARASSHAPAHTRQVTRAKSHAKSEEGSLVNHIVPP